MPPTMTPHLVNPSSAAVPSTAKAPRPTLQALPASPPPPDTSQGPAVLPALSPAVPVPAGEMTASELARVLDGTSQWADPDGPLFSIGAPPLPHVTPLAGPSDAFSGPSVAPAAGHVGQGGHSDPMSVAALTQPAAATLEVPEGALAGVFGREHGGTEASGVPLAAPEYSASLPVSLPLTVGPLSGLPEPASPLPDLTTALQPPTTAPQPVLSVEALMAAVGAPAPAPAPVPFRSAPAGPQGGVSDARCDIPAEKPPGGSEDAAGGVKSELHTRCKVVMADVPTDHGRTHFRGVTRHRRTGRFEGHIW